MTNQYNGKTLYPKRYAKYVSLDRLSHKIVNIPLNNIGSDNKKVAIRS